MILYKLLKYKQFWVLRKKYLNTKFWINSKLYKLNRYYDERKKSSSITSELFRLTITSTLRAIIFIIAILFVEKNLIYFFNHDSSSYSNFFKSIISIIPLIDYNNPTSREAIIEFLSAIAGVSGLILGLFFPILATIASTAYSKVSSNIRNLLFQEPYSQRFLRHITFLASSSLLILVSIALGFYPNILVIGFVILFSIATLYSLINLGLGIFQYFDPSKLMEISIKDAMKYSKEVTPKGVHWLDSSFQNHY